MIDFNSKKIKENVEFNNYLLRIAKEYKCFMCKHKFEKPLLKKQPFKIIPLMNMFNPEFLVHLKTTHGIEPEDFYSMLKKKIK